MTTTANQTIAASAGWELVATGSISVTIQLLSDGPLLIVAQGTEPGASSTEGFVLDANGETVFAANDLSATDNVYAKVLRGTDDQIAVMAS